MDTNLQELREKIKGHILAIREDVKNAGFDASYITMAMFEDSENGRNRNSAFIFNDKNVKYEKQFDFYYNFTEEEE